MLSWLITDCQAKDSRLESADHAAMKMDAPKAPWAAAAVRQNPGADSWAVPSTGIAEAVGNREIDPALPGMEKYLRYRLPRAAD
jgi:hypothetical protein